MSLFNNKVVYKPMDYAWAEQFRLESEQMHWLTDEVDMSQDLVDFNEKLSKDEQEFVKNILSIFTQSDKEVGNYYIDFLMPAVKRSEVRGMLASCCNREWEHQRGYAQLNESLGLPESYYTDFMEHTATLDKYNFYTNNPQVALFGHRIAKQVLTEGIALFGAFVMLKNFERHGLLLGTCKINEWSLKDETLHIEANSKLFRVWAEEFPEAINSEFKKVIYDMNREVVRLEEAFIDFAFSKHTIRDLKAEEVKRYIKYISNRRMNQLGLKAEFPEITSNPLPWFEELSNGSSLQNFFEGRSADYDIAGLTGEWRY